MNLDAQMAIDFSSPTLAEARASRDVGMERVADKAEREEPCFAARAYAELVHYSTLHAEFSGEDATDAIKAAGIVPHNDKAFGPIYMAAARNGLIRRIGFVPRRKGHGSPGPLYARVQ